MTLMGSVAGFGLRGVWELKESIARSSSGELRVLIFDEKFGRIVFENFGQSRAAFPGEFRDHHSATQLEDDLAADQSTSNVDVKRRYTNPLFIRLRRVGHTAALEDALLDVE